ncbi:hypothetical protein BC629DRAFT_610636 [Irpex lacteus]|nr:hypothetical protein BC629DRAFT_610636 [Irpex lacteus]
MGDDAVNDFTYEIWRAASLDRFASPLTSFFPSPTYQRTATSSSRTFNQDEGSSGAWTLGKQGSGGRRCIPWSGRPRVSPAAPPSPRQEQVGLRTGVASKFVRHASRFSMCVRERARCGRCMAREIGGWIDESFHCVGVIRQPQMGCMYSEDQPPGPSSHCHRAM